MFMAFLVLHSTSTSLQIFLFYFLFFDTYCILSYIVLHFLSLLITNNSLLPTLLSSTFSMLSYWYIMMQLDYFYPQFFILWHIYLSFFQYQIFFFLPFLPFQYLHFHSLHLLYYSNYFLILTLSYFYFF